MWVFGKILMQNTILPRTLNVRPKEFAASIQRRLLLKYSLMMETSGWNLRSCDAISKN